MSENNDACFVEVVEKEEEETLYFKTNNFTLNTLTLVHTQFNFQAFGEGIFPFIGIELSNKPRY